MRRIVPIAFILLLAACGRGEIVRPVEPTAYVPPRSATATAEALDADRFGTDAPGDETTDSETATVAGDAALGETLFNEFQAEVNFACSTCHLADSETRLIGPGLRGVSERAATRVQGLSAGEYVRQSIIDPNAFVVEGYPENLMPQVFAEIFTEEQIDNLIAYLMTL